MAAMIPTLSFCCHIWRRYDSLFMQTPCRVGTTHMRPKGPLLAEHKFRTGEKVRLAANVTNRSAAGGGYVVTRQLPERNGEFEYRIKNISEPHERVARESELARE
jgi:hypothetical protein